MLPILFDSFLDEDMFKAFRTLNPNASTLKLIPLNMEDTVNNYVITAELPGVKKDNINVTLSDGLLKLEVLPEKEEKSSKYILKERQSSYRSRSISIPKEVKEDSIKASMENGILTILIEKIPKESSTKKILIN